MACLECRGKCRCSTCGNPELFTGAHAPREVPRNLQAEPAYPGAEHVVMLSMSHPEWTGHLRHPDCEREEPHRVEECGVYAPAPVRGLFRSKGSK